jgi:hypothetical protein
MGHISVVEVSDSLDELTSHELDFEFGQPGISVEIREEIAALHQRHDDELPFVLRVSDLVQEVDYIWVADTLEGLDFSNSAKNTGILKWLRNTRIRNKLAGNL